MAPTVWALRVIGRPPGPAMTGRPAPTTRHTDWRFKTVLLSLLKLPRLSLFRSRVESILKRPRPSAGKQQDVLLRHKRSPRFSFSDSLPWQTRPRSLGWLR